MSEVYNRYNVQILCIADSLDATDLQAEILKALKTVPKLTVKATTFDTWTDGMTGAVREYDENGKEIIEEAAAEDTAAEETSETTETGTETAA